MATKTNFILKVQDAKLADVQKALKLAGVLFDGEKGLKGNSDSDAVLHAIANAISSSIGGKSLATWSDAMHAQGIDDSAEYVNVAFQRLKSQGYRVENVSISIECAKPKITPKTEEMQERIGMLLEIDPERVGITATSGEGLTAFGKGEGVQAFAIVLVVQP